MGDLIAPKSIGRLAAAFFLLSGVSWFARLALIDKGAEDRAAFTALAAAAVLIGIACAAVPWDRMHRWVTIGLVPVGLVMVAASNVLWLNPWAYGTSLLLLFVWVGLAHRRFSSLALLPFAVVAGLAPFRYEPLPDDARYGLFVLLAVCVVAGESLATAATRMRRAEASDKRRMGDMESLLQVTVRLVRQDDASEVAGLVAETAVSLLRARGAVVLLMGGDGQMRAVAYHDWPPPTDLALDADATRAQMPSESLQWFHGSPFPALPAPERAPHVLSLALASRGVWQGIILVCFTTDVSEHDPFVADLARTFATQASLAIERVHATQTLVSATLRDELTGVGNRRHGDTALERIQPGDGVAIIDLDFFKQVNDKWGHAAGDRVLERLGQHLTSSIREKDSAARWGGEEFIVILHQVRGQAYEVVNRMLVEWRAARVGTTFSAGVAIHKPGQTPNQTLVRADEALYKAKESGRDRVIVAPDVVADKRSEF